MPSAPDSSIKSEREREREEKREHIFFLFISADVTLESLQTDLGRLLFAALLKRIFPCVLPARAVELIPHVDETDTPATARLAVAHVLKFDS